MQGRLQKILSARGIASRRASELLILEGRVTVNGSVAPLGCVADDEFDDIMVDGVPLPPLEKPVYIMLNKPQGYVTTMKDERGRKTVTELVAGAGVKVYPIGRLDMETEGLLLMTNDGSFANSVMHPSFNKIKKYEVRVQGDVDKSLKLLREPISIDGHTVKAVSVAVAERRGDKALLILEIAEGRNRQIRKMCAECGLMVFSLRRVAIGPLTLGGLEPGKWRFLTAEETGLLFPGTTDGKN